MLAACTFIRAAIWQRVLMNLPRVLKYTLPNVQLALPRSTACIYAANYTRLTVCHVYSYCTRGELHVAIYAFFCSVYVFSWLMFCDEENWILILTIYFLMYDVQCISSTLLINVVYIYIYIYTFVQYC
jgi:hypothetical protein